MSRDLKDDKFIATAAAAGAAYLVSEDQDLRVLQEYAVTKIVTCRQFLDVLERLAAEEPTSQP